MSAETVLALEAARHRQLEQELKQARERIAALEAQYAKLREAAWETQHIILSIPVGAFGPKRLAEYAYKLRVALGHSETCASMMERGWRCDCSGVGGGQ